MYCRKCGQELSADAGICSKCGAAVSPQKAAAENGVVSTGDWFVSMLVACIPLIGIIMMFVWAFGGTVPSKKNWARAVLIWWAVAIVLAIVLSVIFGVSIGALLASLAD